MRSGSSYSVTFRHLSILAVIFLGAHGLVITEGLAQDTPEPARSPRKLEPIPGVYTGPASCASSGCHGSPAPVEGEAVLMNEYDTWLHAPAPTHVRAWEVLLQPRSRQIARNLGLTQAPEVARECVGCHATVVEPGEELRPGVIEIADGVSCETCHGPAGGWLSGHIREGWSHQDSVDAGMVDLADLVTRARKCMGCHVGNDEYEVTHDYIAAGHPILIFELDNFTNSNLMPRHWRAAPERHGVEAWAVGQIAALRLEASNLRRHAQSRQWPEFTHMSCASCHHNLSDGEWRQQRGFHGRTGMPLWSPERWIVARHVISLVAPRDAERIARLVDELSREVGRMVDRERIAELARSLEEILTAIAPRVERQPWDGEEITRLIEEIRNDATDYLIADRQSAEQATLSLISLASELDRRERGSMTTTIDALYRLLDRLEHPDEYDREAFAAMLADLDA